MALRGVSAQIRRPTDASSPATETNPKRGGTGSHLGWDLPLGTPSSFCHILDYLVCVQSIPAVLIFGNLTTS